MGSHINNDGEFQSDKYPTCPAGKVPLSTKDLTAQDLLWEYAERRREVDAEFSNDLQATLTAKGFTPEISLGEPFWLRVAKAAGVEDADTLGAIIQRVQALHDGVLRSHRAVPDEKGYDVCGDCGADIEDALTAGVVCPKYGTTLVADVIAPAARLYGDALFQGPGTSGAVGPDGSDPTKKKAT